jgi:RNA polymerase sigma factor for flagellar operon FliA
MTTAHTTYSSIANLASSIDERNHLVMQELPQVYYIASRILERLPQQVELTDLVNAGVIGLLEAYEKFDSEKNTQFKTFAKFRIRGAILDSLRELDWGSRSLRRKAREITDTTKQLESQLGRKAGRDEVATEMKVSLRQLEDVMMQIEGLQVFGQQTSSGVNDADKSLDLIETALSHWENPFEAYCKVEQKEKLTEAISQLSEREQLILSLYYHEELTMKEVAEVVGIAVSRVSQIHFAALGKLKALLVQAEQSRNNSPAPAKVKKFYNEPRKHAKAIAISN